MFCALVPLFLTLVSIFSTTVTHLKICEERDGDLGDVLLQTRPCGVSWRGRAPYSLCPSDAVWCD